MLIHMRANGIVPILAFERRLAAGRGMIRLQRLEFVYFGRRDGEIGIEPAVRFELPPWQKGL